LILGFVCFISIQALADALSKSNYLVSFKLILFAFCLSFCCLI